MLSHALAQALTTLARPYLGPADPPPHVSGLLVHHRGYEMQVLGPEPGTDPNRLTVRIDLADDLADGDTAVLDELQAPEQDDGPTVSDFLYLHGEADELLQLLDAAADEAEECGALPTADAAEQFLPLKAEADGQDILSNGKAARQIATQSPLAGDTAAAHRERKIHAAACWLVVNEEGDALYLTGGVEAASTMWRTTSGVTTIADKRGEHGSLAAAAARYLEAEADEAKQRAAGRTMAEEFGQ